MTLKTDQAHPDPTAIGKLAARPRCCGLDSFSARRARRDQAGAGRRDSPRSRRWDRPPPRATSTPARSTGRAGTARRRTTERCASAATPRPAMGWRGRRSARSWARRPFARGAGHAGQHREARAACGRTWQPFYSDAVSGAGKEMESRNAESVLNAVILSSYDQHTGPPERDHAHRLRQRLGAAVHNRPRPPARGFGRTSTTRRGSRRSRNTTARR